MTEDPVGGRVLVVAPTESTPDSDGGTFVRGGDASGIGRGEDRSAVDGGGETPGGAGAAADDGENSASNVDTDDRTGGGPDEQPRDPYRGGHGRGCDPETVAAGIADRLPVDVVLRNEQTAGEYLEELGPTLDCVVVLGGETGPLGRLAEDVSVPAVVVERPVVETEAERDGAIPVSTVVDRVRSAVRGARSRSDLRDQNTRLTALSRYARDITGCETVDAVLDRTAEAATDALAFDHSVILLLEGDQLVPSASELPPPDLSSCDRTEGIAGRTLATGEAEIVDDMQTDPDAVPEHDDLHAVISVPIGEWGVIQIASNERGAFDERDLEFVEILAGYAREALERLEREATLREERDRLHAFYDALPIPALCVERCDGETTIENANHAYEEQFGEVAVCRPLSAVLPTDAEREQYERTLARTEPSKTTITRQVADGTSREFTLTVIPVSQPSTRDSAFGVYRDASE